MANPAVRRKLLEAKPMTRAELSRRIDLAAIERAAQVEPELIQLIRCLGILPDL